MASTSKICDVEVCETVRAATETCSLVGCFYRRPYRSSSWITECRSAQVTEETCTANWIVVGSCREAATTLQLFPHEVKVIQLLLPADCEKQHRYCEWLLAEVEDDPGMLYMTSFSIEAWFRPTGYVNSENSRIWSKGIPHTTHETPHHSIGLWFAVSHHGIAGSSLLEKLHWHNPLVLWKNFWSGYYRTRTPTKKRYMPYGSGMKPFLFTYPQIYFLFNFVPPKLLVYNSSYTQSIIDI
jgi:hypothetical protein